MGKIGGNVMLSAALAFLSYLPFDVVAKGGLFFGVALFILDPIPPVTRLLALITTGVVGVLAKLHREWEENQLSEDEQLQRTGLQSKGDVVEPEGYVVVDKNQPSLTEKEHQEQRTEDSKKTN